MDYLRLMAELHGGGARQGPGGEAQTRLAMQIAGLSPSPDLRIADIGCGTGAATRVLAASLGARVTAVDLVPAFLDRLRAEADAAGLGDRVRTLACPMTSLPFAEGELDAIWSEGAIYNMGFEAGVAAWRRFLKPGGILAVSELTWLTATRPPDLEAHWLSAYSEVDTAAAKMAVLERQGYSPLGYFVLPESCWLENFYRPMERRFPAFLEANSSSAAAREIVEAEIREIRLYEALGAYFGYGFYIARRTDEGEGSGGGA
jgi:SAM-dependent methyltransferase